MNCAAMNKGCRGVVVVGSDSIISFADGVASWLTQRQVSVILATRSQHNGFRRLSEISKFVGDMDSSAIRGLLAQNGASFGGVFLSEECDRRDIGRVLNSYDIAVLVHDITGKCGWIGVGAPYLIIIENSSAGIKAAQKYIDDVIASGETPRIIGFCLERYDNRLAAMISRRMGIPALGSLDDIAAIALKISDRAELLDYPSYDGMNSVSYDPKGINPQDGGDQFNRAVMAISQRMRDDEKLKRMVMQSSDNNREDALEIAKAIGRREAMQIADEAIIHGDLAKAVDIAVDDVIGYGPIEPLFRDDEVTEIMVCGADKIYFERGGTLVRSGARFRDEKHLMLCLDRMVASSGRRIDESSPMVDSRLPDGSRLNAVIRPVAIDGPAITIRRFKKRIKCFDQLLKLGMLDLRTVEYLKQLVRKRVTIIVSGGTGSGKTTMLNVLASSIEPSERVVTIEDSAELDLQTEHIVRMEARPPSIEGSGEIAIRDLVRNALRMRPDRIMIGECRGAEAFDMLQAMNTGHEGSMTTIHANSPRDALSRLETMVMMSGADIPLIAVREQIARAIDVIVQLVRSKDGTRRISAISEITSIEGNIICMQDIASSSLEGGLRWTGIKSKYYEMSKT